MELDAWSGMAPLPAVAAAAEVALTEAWFDPGAPHARTAGPRARLEAARHAIGALVGRPAGQVRLTSGGTEAANWAVKGAAWSRTRHGRHVLISATSHLDVRNAAHWLHRQGWEVEHLPVRTDGRLDLDALLVRLRDDTVVVSVEAANHETGVIQPVADVIAAVRAASPRAVVHVDAAVAAGRQSPETWSETDLLTLDAAPLGAVRGAGALIQRPGARLEALHHGGPQETGRRAGVPALVPVAALGAAAAGWVEHGGRWREDLAHASAALEQHLLATGLVSEVLGADAPRLPGVIAATQDGVAAEPVVVALDARGVHAASASGCASLTGAPSHVLTAMGLDETSALASLRFTLPHAAEAADPAALIAHLRAAIDETR